jgi:hypothetical protein
MPEVWLDGRPISIPLVRVPDGFTVQAYSRTLCQLPSEVILSNDCIGGVLIRVQIISTTRGQRKLPVQFFYGPICKLRLDPTRVVWPDHLALLEYLTQKGRMLLRWRHQLLDLATKKWKFILPNNF